MFSWEANAFLCMWLLSLYSSLISEKPLLNISLLSSHHWQSTLGKGTLSEHTQPFPRYKTLEAKCRLNFSTLCPHSQGPLWKSALRTSHQLLFVGVPLSGGSPFGRMSVLRGKGNTVSNYAVLPQLVSTGPSPDKVGYLIPQSKCKVIGKKAQAQLPPTGPLAKWKTLHSGSTAASNSPFSALPLISFPSPQLSLSQANQQVHDTCIHEEEGAQPAWWVPPLWRRVMTSPPLEAQGNL